MKAMQLIKNNWIRSILILWFPLVGITVQAAPTLTLTATNGTCVSDCKITASVSGAVAPVTYSLINYPVAGQNSSPQIANVFSDLPPGTYTVGVYDATTAGVPVTGTITVSTSYVPILASDPTVGYTTSEYCGNNGTLRISFSGGKAPFRVKITNQSAPYNFQETTVTSTASSKNTTFTSLPSGQYVFEIEDACGQWQQNKPGIYVTVDGAMNLLNGVTFNSLDATRSSYSYASAGYSAVATRCTHITFSYYYGDLKLSTSAGILDLLTYTQLKFRIEYPANSGIYTDWLNGYYTPAFSITNYDRSQTNGDKYRVQVQHPCTNAILSSPVYTFPAEGQFRVSTSATSSTSDYCSPLISVTLPSSISYGEILYYNCNAPYTVVLKSGTTAVATKTISTSAYSTSFDGGNGVQPSTAYTIEITGQNGFTQTLSVTTPAASLSSRTTYYLHNNYNSTTTSYVTGYNYANVCDFTTTGIYANLINPIAGKPVTYSIAASGTTPAITRAPITLTAPGRLWTDLPWGTYNVTANYGCGTYTNAVTLTQTVTGFNNATLIYRDYVTVCGSYSLIGDAWYNMNGTRFSNTNSAYWYYMQIVSGPAKVGSSYRVYGYSYNNTTSDTYKAIINDLPGGTYKVVFYPFFAQTSTQTIYGTSMTYPVNSGCIIEREVIVPEYIRPVIDVPLSGGISCTNGLTNMTINVKSSSNRSPFVYRYKAAGATDSAYTPADFQTSNVFSSIAPGNYTVQVKDQCGSITTQNVRVFNGNEQFVGIIGEVQPGVICETREVSLSVLSIGPVQWYKWYYSSTGAAGTWTTLPSTGPTYVISSANQSHKGYYKVEIHNGLCQLESQVRIIDVLPPATAPTITGPTVVCSNGNAVLTAQTAVSSPYFQWYRNGTAITGANSSTYTATTAGSYTVDVTPYQACPSNPSSAHVVTEGTITPAVVVSANPGFEVCETTVTSILFTPTPTNGGSTPSYVWKIAGTQVGTGPTYTLSNLGQHRPKTTISCTMTSSAACTTTATATDTKDVRISSCVVPVNPNIRGKITN